MKKAKVLALTQRAAPTPDEKRDALARDWYPFLKALGVPWLVLPNEPGAALGLARHFDPAGLILTGGDDVGLCPARDETEAALMDWAGERYRPVLGVCRGFQFIHLRLGGTLAPVEPELHRARRHRVEFADGSAREVNSYHNFAPSAGFAAGSAGFKSLEPQLTKGKIKEPKVQGWEVWAVCPEDGAAEAARAPGLLGLSWHPEREAEPREADLEIFRRHLLEAR